MELGKRIVNARKKKGFTQQQLADLTKLTVRTIQRIESGASLPRPYTINAIANSLDSTFEELTRDEVAIHHTKTVTNDIDEIEDQKNFLQMLCLSCFLFVLIPFVHFLVPMRMLKKSPIKNQSAITFSRKVIRTQIWWHVYINLSLMLCLVFNLISAKYFGKLYVVNYLVPFFVMYLFNVFTICKHLLSINYLFNYPEPKKNLVYN